MAKSPAAAIDDSYRPDATARPANIFDECVHAVPHDPGNKREWTGRTESHTRSKPPVHRRRIAAEHNRSSAKLDHRSAGDQTRDSNADEHVFGRGSRCVGELCRKPQMNFGFWILDFGFGFRF